ncbi:hypothetical protein WHR41_02780 [Cladosporium halotolerans]|uniref:Uncharacterized protein n=1 Tax=Cladosporium halotolerans TaxID=1052096 RepID=A0AB34KYX9_9PEZI
MSHFTTRNMLLAAGGLGALAMFFPRTAKTVSSKDSIFETQGVKNVGSRYAAQGGSNTHQPGVATPRGNPDNTISYQEHEKGLATPPFENSQSDQKVGYSSAPAAQFYKATAGNEKGK